MKQQALIVFVMHSNISSDLTSIFSVIPGNAIKNERGPRQGLHCQCKQGAARSITSIQEKIIIKWNVFSGTTGGKKAYPQYKTFTETRG